MKTIFLNCSPNKNASTYRIGEEVLKEIEHEILQMSDYKICQYGQVCEDDQISEIFKRFEDKNNIVIGVPVYWYTVGGILKTFIDRLYMLPEAEILKGKNLYLFAQGSAPDKDTKKSITFLANRVADLMGMNLKSVIIDSSAGDKIIKNMKICE